MESSNSNGQRPAPNGTGNKAPLVKRIKVPTVRPGTPPVQAAGQAEAASLQSDPAAKLEAQYIGTKEPDLPPEDKNNAPAGNAAGAQEAEKLSARKKRRGASSEPLEKEENPQITKAKIHAKKFLSNVFVRLGIVVVLIGIILGGIYSSLPIIAEKKLPTLFANNGMPFHRFTLKTLTIDTMELANISDKTGTMTISSMKFNYSLMNLYTGNTIRSAELSGVTIQGEKRNDGFSLGVLGDLIYSPVNVHKGNELTINSLKISNGTFVMKNDAPPKKIVNEDGEEEEIDNTIYIKFNANGSLSKTGLNLQAETDYTTPQAVLKTASSLTKTAMSSQIKTEITEGTLLKNDQKEGDISGNLEITVNNGVLTTGSANLVLSSSSQKLKLNADIIPKESCFDISLDMDRSFDDPKDAVGKFVGSLSVHATDLTVKGTFEKFEGVLPLHIKAPLLTNGLSAVRDLIADMDTKISCSGSKCSVALIKPMKFSFSNLQTGALFKQVKFVNPLELTINPDPKEPFLKTEGNLFSFTLPISAFSTQIFLADNRSNIQVATALNGLKARVKYNIFSGAYSGDAVFQQSGYADKDIRLAGVQGMVTFASNSLPDARLRVAKVTLTKPNILPDFSTEIRFRPIKKTEFGIDSVIQIQNGLLNVTANGSYSLLTHDFDMYVVVPKFILSDTDLKLSSVLPFMLEYLPDTTTGGFAMKGRIASKDGAVVGPLNILFENVETTLNNAKAEAVNGVVTLTSLIPLATPENQQIFAGIFNTGIPFNDLLMNFHIVPQKGIEVSNIRMKYAGAQFKTIKSFSIPYEGQPSQILLEGNGLNLSMLTHNLKSSALQMDGVMNSEWMLSLTDDKKLKINRALFTTKLPGTLHFTAPDSLKGSMNPQMLNYLKDVIVKNMKITANGQMDGQITFDVSIKGHSPLETEENDQDVSFDFKSSFKNLLKQEGGRFEIPSDILLSLQNYTK